MGCLIFPVVGPVIVPIAGLSNSGSLLNGVVVWLDHEIFLRLLQADIGISLSVLVLDELIRVCAVRLAID